MGTRIGVDIGGTFTDFILIDQEGAVREELQEAAGGLALTDITHAIVEALDPDHQYAVAQQTTGKDDPGPEDLAAAVKALLDAAVEPLATNPALREKLIEVRRSYEQTIDEASKDVLLETGYSAEATDRARETVESFRQFIEDHKDDILALQVLYSRPYRQRLTFKEIKELAHSIGRPPYAWTPEKLWAAYDKLDRSKVRGSGPRTLTDIVSLVRFSLQHDDELVPFPERSTSGSKAGSMPRSRPDDDSPKSSFGGWSASVTTSPHPSASRLTTSTSLRSSKTVASEGPSRSSEVT